jgi:hypothetical protein
LLLKLLLGIADDLLQGPEAEQQMSLSLDSLLCQQVLRVLFDAWLRSKTTNAELWSLLALFCRKWTHRKWLCSTSLIRSILSTFDSLHPHFSQVHSSVDFGGERANKSARFHLSTTSRDSLLTQLCCGVSLGRFHFSN